MLDSSESLLRAANNSKEFGKYKLADYFLKKPIGRLSRKKGFDAAFEIIKKRLDFYLEIRRDNKLLRFARRLSEEDGKKKRKMFNGKQRSILAERVKRHIRVLQDKTTAEEIKKVIFHFDTLKILNPVERVDYTFFQGEALYFQKKYFKALNYYRQVVDRVISGVHPNKKIVIKKTFDSIIKSLGKVKFNKSQKEKWNIYVYTSHIKIYPVSERSRKMYQKLYNIYYQNKKYEKCKNILLSYIKSYPHRKNGKIINRSDIEKHQVMISKIIDYYVKKEDYVRAYKETEWLRKKKFAFDEKVYQQGCWYS